MHYTDLFNDKSELYAEARPSYPQDLYVFLAKQCNETSRAWDCACGNGQSAISLVKQFKEVIATDVSPKQIENAFKHPYVTYTVSPSEATAFDSEYFDIVCVAQALHWMKFEDFWKETKRVLKPNGIFAAWGYSWTKLSPDVDAIVQTYLLDVIEPYWAKQNKLLWNHYRDIPIPFKSIEVPDFVMKTDWTLAQFLAYLHTWSSTRRCIDAIGDSFLAKLYFELEKAWGNPEQSNVIEFDFCCFVGRYKI